MRTIAGVLLLLTVPVAADSAVMFEFPDHRTVGLVSTGEVTMLEESVTIAPSGGMYDPWGEDYGWLPNMHVSCMFRLLNTSDSVQEVIVGFPFDARYGDSYTVFSDAEVVALFDSTRSDEERLPWAHAARDGEYSAGDVPEELDFTAVADGDTLEVYYRDCAWELDELLVWQPTVAVWRMRFEPGQEVRLTNTYNTSWDYHAGGPDANFTMDYVVTSGATWSGDIGRAVITLDIPPEFPAPQLSDTVIASWEWSGRGVLDEGGRRITWEYTDWEPDENISFRLHTLVDAGIWQEGVMAGEMETAIDWTPEGLLPSVHAYMYEDLVWTGRFHEEFLLHMAEAVPYIRAGIYPPSAGVSRYFLDFDPVGGPGDLSAEDLSRLEVVRQVEEDLLRDMELVEEAGYERFLPIFRLRWKWDTDLSGMWADDPDALEAFRELTAAREAMERGESPADEAVLAFFRLTGDALVPVSR